MPYRSYLPFAVILWAVAVIAGLAARPILPVDETRYVSVAWEMWLRGDFLVPYLNGETYSHKPPLLFWLMQAGWALFGVNDVTPRLVAPLFGLGAVIMTWVLARKLWPDCERTVALAPVLLMGAIFWALFASLTMFDMLLALCTLIGLYGAVEAVRGRMAWGGILLALGIGLGGLAKGPAILLHILPVCLTAPWWAPALTGDRLRLSPFFVMVLLGLIGGISITLAWAIPAGISGGEAYRNAIFWGQSAGRVVNSFDHGRPFWWYAAVLPPLVLPWLVWPVLWRRGFALGRSLLQDGAVRLLLVWVMTAFVVFSAISGKQLHYLLPEFPALALFAARLLAQGDSTEKRALDTIPPFVVLAVVGFAVFGVFALDFTPSWATTADGGVALPMAVIGILASMAAWRLRLPAVHVAPVISGFSVALILALNVSAGPAVRASHNLAPFAEHLKTWEDQGYEIGFFGRTYHGHFHFLGRLTKPFDWVGSQELDDWIATHPKAKLITYNHKVAPPKEDEPDFVHPFRSGYFSLWDTARHGKHPQIIPRN